MMPARPRFFGVRRVLDFAAAALCIWAGVAHTPPGALLRLTIAKLTNTRTSARPLFAYYTGGIYESAPAIAKPLPPPVHALSAQDALGAGAAIALDNLEAAQRSVPLSMLAREGVNEREALDPRAGPHHLAIALTRLRDRYGSEDLAMLALFCGDESARYAKEQAPANAELPQLVRVLPRGLCDRGPLAGQALSLATALSLEWPVSERARISSPFGVREHPVLGVERMHKGVDLAVPEGTPVRAGGKGTVRRASEDDVNGKIVILDHGRGVTCAFLHNSELLVERGDAVARAQQVSRSGGTGRSTGPHLHYQLEIAGTAVDPLLYRAHP